MLIIDCRNLIGDTVYLIKPLRRFLESQNTNEVALAIDDGLPGTIVRRSFPGHRTGQLDSLLREWPDAERITLSASSAWRQTRSDDSHISLGYARIFNTEPPDGAAPDVEWLPAADPEMRPEYIALAPFSVSCARHRGEPPNKTLNESDWAPLLEMLRGYGWPLRIVGGPSERFPATLGFAESDYFSADTLEELVSFLRGSRVVVGVDTGVCHISSCAGVPTVVLWSSAANLKFIGATWAPRTRIVHIGLPTQFDTRRVTGLLKAAMQELTGRPATTDTSVTQGMEAARGSRTFPALDSAAFRPLRQGAGGLRNWSGHLPFARDLVASLRPRLLVELGTHYGESYFGFCQSVAETGIDCSCYAVDTWQGDSHSLEYGDEVYREVEAHNQARYDSFSRLLRMRFDEALAWFADESIDLLHIDGLHTYDAVRQDFEAWFPKVAPGGIVLLHDTAERYADFGVWKLWEEIAGAHDSFLFHHSHGLGVIRKPGGSRTGDGILDYLFAGENAEAIRRYYTLCADRLEAKEAAGTSNHSPEGTEVRRVAVDPGPAALEALTGDPAPGQREGAFIAVRVGESDVYRTDWSPVEGKNDTWQATTRDPLVMGAAGLDAASIRFFIVTMSCSCEEPRPQAQLFWTARERTNFTERVSIRWPLIADRQLHTYVVDLHAGAGFGAVNHLWRYDGRIGHFRFDPIDMPGEFTILSLGFAHENRAEAAGVRQALGLATLRSELSYRYLTGSGIEIGALQNPLPLRPDADVRYVDRLTLAEARARFPELGSAALVTPDIISDATSLEGIPDRSVDFVVANHVLEHLRDPLQGLGEWMRVLRPGGHAYIAAPDHTNPLDRHRSVTSLEHIVADFKDRANRKELDREHYREWAESTRRNLSGDELSAYAADLADQGYDIHFHTFSDETFAGLLRFAQTYFPADLIELRRTYGTPSDEHIAILRKQ
jgi:SAM-dependent methyltransferase